MSERPLPIINAAGPLTWLGGGPLAPGVGDAMREAAGRTWDLLDLHQWAGARLAELLGVPGVFVTSGASAAMTLSAAAAITGGRYAEMAALPDLSPRKALAIQRSHRTAYDRAWRTAGADFREFGFAGPPGTGTTQAWQLAGILEDPAVAGVAFTEDPAITGLSLAATVQVAHERGRPVLVDAAACLPPLARLHAVVATGADFVAVSGGKALGGPQNSGLLVCAPDQVHQLALQTLDMDVDEDRFERWAGRTEMGLPHHGIGRGFKVSKEALIGLVAATEYFVQHYGEIAGRWERILDVIAASLDRAGLTVLRDDGASGGPRLSVAASPARLNAVAVALRAGLPRVEVSRHHLTEGRMDISPVSLRDEDVPVLVDRIIEAWHTVPS